MRAQTSQRLDRLIRILADGRFHSGQALANALDVSRTAVWQLLQHIQKWQVPVYAVQGKGYQIPGGLELLDPSALEKSLLAKDMPFQALKLFSSIDSTARFMEDWWRNEPGFTRICIAEHQSAGRGRQGRRWVSPFASNFYFSIGIQMPMGLNMLGGLSLATGIGLARLLTPLIRQPIKVKWPNDLLVGGRKLAGILVQASGDSTDKSFINLGIGVNWQMPETAAADIDQPWCHLKPLLNQPMSRQQMLLHIVKASGQVLRDYARNGFAPFAQHWPSLSAFIHQPVRIQSPQKTITGVEVGIDEQGALRVQTASTVEKIYSGELSLRGDADE